MGVVGMRRLAILFILPLLPSVSTAASATQTDWSGGPGLALPVIEWGTSFGPASLVDWFNDSGALSLDLLQTELAWDVDDFSDMTLVDLDGDGLQDVLASGTFSKIIWFRNTGLSLPWPCQAICDWENIADALPIPGDMDGDGDPDVVFANSRDVVLWAENRLPETSWTLHAITGQQYRIMTIDTADVDGDGDLDVFGARAENEWVGWWENTNGLGTSWVEHYIDDSVWYPHWVEAADLDMDGLTDLLLVDADSDPDRARWYENPGSPWTTWPVHLINDAIDMPRQITAFEMNGLPGVELLMNSVNTTEMCWFEQESPDSWIRHQIETGGSGVWAAYPSDIDGDGDQDIGAYQEELTVCVYWNDDAEPWQPERITFSGHPGGSVVLDYDEDGQNELLVSHIRWNSWDIPYLSAYELDDYEPSGTADSRVLDTQAGGDWGSISWEAVQPPGTSVGFQVTSGPAYTLMRDWSDTLNAPCNLDGILVEGDRFFQYRAILRTSDQQMTPELQEVTVDWNPLGVVEPQEPVPWLAGPFPNPVTGSSTLELTLESSAFVSVEVFDLSGRLSSVLAHQIMTCGLHEIRVSRLPAGIYILRASLGGERVTARFMVLN
jgi:hypothetical protein